MLFVLLIFSQCKKKSVANKECRPTYSEVARIDDELEIIVLGDQGCGNENAKMVAQEMSKYAQKNKVDFVIGVGDNIYESGVSNSSDPKFKTHFEDMFDLPQLNIPFYLTLGNHDYEGSIDGQINYTSRSSRWKMPGRYYSFKKEIPGGKSVAFFAIDTYELINSDGKRQLSWLTNALKNSSSSSWRIVFGHHPMYNNGNYGDDHELIQKLAPLFDKYNVELFAAGHEHTIQFLTKKDKTNFIVSGSACKLGSSECRSNTIYNANKLGFATLRIKENEIIVQSVLSGKGLDYVYKIQ